MNYTKGEWKANLPAVTGNWKVGTPEERIAIVLMTQEDDEDSGNAQLIASAPDLYEALKAIDDLDLGDANELIDKALAKAEGKC